MKTHEECMKMTCFLMVSASLLDVSPKEDWEVYTQLVMEGEIVETPEGETPQVPMDYTWAKKLGMIRST